MTFIKIDNSLSYELVNNKLTIFINDKYFSTYRLVNDIVEILKINGIGEKDSLIKLTNSLYTVSKHTKNSALFFPLELNIILKENQFIFF